MKQEREVVGESITVRGLNAAITRDRRDIASAVIAHAIVIPPELPAPLAARVAVVPRPAARPRVVTLYVLLHRRRPGAKAPYDTRVRIWLWLSLFIGSPFGVLLTLICAALRSGATVHVVARRPDRCGS